ncbi:unnamed protein product [Strongylus vulgaris]|uniref:Pinin/SDK/MemA protein domain-containing protein n=1 Tax=Strongylus vulgaris TaxID=40348 RepID=A0A3P7KXP0_STRVU|nr:unnamed protein product [Strongylus vulgaris]
MELRQKELERELENSIEDDHQEQNTSGVNDAEAGNSKDTNLARRGRDRSYSRSGDEDEREKSPESTEVKEKSAEHEEVHENNDEDEAMGEEERIQPDDEAMEKDD